MMFHFISLTNVTKKYFNANLTKTDGQTVRITTSCIPKKIDINMVPNTDTNGPKPTIKLHVNV